MANDPPILVADEPTGNLNSVTAESIFNLFENLVAGGKTILMVTHDLDLASRATRTILLVDGEIADGDEALDAVSRGGSGRHPMFKLKPRWRKVLRDLWLNKNRTIVVVLSIAVGVFAVGTIASSQIILSRDLRATYLASNPGSRYDYDL